MYHFTHRVQVQSKHCQFSMIQFPSLYTTTCTCIFACCVFVYLCVLVHVCNLLCVCTCVSLYVCASVRYEYIYVCMPVCVC